MADFIEEIVTDLLSGYREVMGNVFNNFTFTILWIIIIYTIYMVLGFIFPPIKNFLRNFLFRPFRLLHIWFHIQACKNLNNKTLRQGIRPKMRVRVSLSMGSYKGYERTMIMLAPTDDRLTVREATRIANASFVPSIMILGVLMMLSPFMMNNLFLIIIHSYLLLGTLTVLMPSRSDNQFIINTFIIKTTISAWYFVFPLIIFAISAGLHVLKYDLMDTFPPFWWVTSIGWGLYSVFIYFNALTIIIMLTYNKDIL
ncbi:MAG: hypothetical protein ACXAC7_22430, partial [Candidatus Hodarchaeales archaeon]